MASVDHGSKYNSADYIIIDSIIDEKYAHLETINKFVFLFRYYTLQLK